MKKNIYYFVLILTTVFVFTLLYKAIFQNNSYIPSSKINKKINGFSASTLFLDNKINIKDLIPKKKITIINIWASWCAPCRNEHEYLMKLKEHPNIVLIGLNYKDKPSKAKLFINDFGNPFSTILKDPKGIISIEIGAYGVPETYILDDNLIIKKKFIGELTFKNFEEIIEIANR
tara:strand:+ start:49 stop:573 length:525 start_codon:yes stop_codon:yes gene_type:complete